jgi:nucleotide-binding universal stress UspA family protein
MATPYRPDDAPILVAVDFSEDSGAALRWAARAAECFDAPLLVLHVVHDPEDAPGSYARAAETPLERIEDVARSMLSEFVERQRAEDPAVGALERLEARIVVGLPTRRILEVAEQAGARLIVMGGRVRTKLADLLLGSKTERVARLATVPVTIVKDEAPGS